jgi:hypothetical protein
MKSEFRDNFREKTKAKTFVPTLAVCGDPLLYFPSNVKLPKTFRTMSTIEKLHFCPFLSFALALPGCYINRPLYPVNLLQKRLKNMREKCLSGWLNTVCNGGIILELNF